MRAGVVLAACAAWAVACGGDFDPSSRVTKLRVLAVQSNQPFAKAGEEVALDVLAVDPEARALSYGFAFCRNPKSSSVLECFASADSSPIVIGTDRAVRFVVPETTTLGIVFAVCPGTLRYRGPSEQPFTCEAGGRALDLSEYELGEKRVILRARDRNANPTIAGVTWDDAPWPENETREITRCAKDTNDFKECSESLAHRIAVQSSAPEEGIDETGANFRERGIVQFYATEGIFEFDVRIADAPETRFVARATTPGEVKMWLVARDDRGGVAWTERRVLVK